MINFEKRKKNIGRSIKLGHCIRNAKAAAGDLLVLTKPIGTGIISFAHELGRAKPEWLEAVGLSMAALNKTAAEVMIEPNVVCATDVTGLGLMGHLVEMTAQSGVSVEIWPDVVPLFPGVRESVRRELVSGAIERNREYAARFVARDPGVPADFETILYDPQTSGGMLMCVRPDGVEDVVLKLRGRGLSAAAVIGRVTGPGEGRIVLRLRMAK